MIESLNQNAIWLLLFTTILVLAMLVLLILIYTHMSNLIVTEETLKEKEFREEKEIERIKMGTLEALSEFNLVLTDDDGKIQTLTHQSFKDDDKQRTVFKHRPSKNK